MKEDKISLAIERFLKRMEKANTEVLKEIASVIEEFDNINPSRAMQIANQLKYGANIKKIEKILSKYSGKTIQDIRDILELQAKDNEEYAKVFYEARNKPLIPIKENPLLNSYLKAVELTTAETYLNLSNTSVMFMLDANGKVMSKSVVDTYKEIVDQCTNLVLTGQTDINTAMRNQLKVIADNGIRKAYYNNEGKRAYSKRIDSALEENVRGAIMEVNHHLDEEYGKGYDADGVIISVHENCAPDHLDIQGYKLKNEEFNKLMKNEAFTIYGNKQPHAKLDRVIGQWNCRHNARSVILDISNPYSEEYLDKIRKQNAETVEYNGKVYTKYQATQVQRRMETKIRELKDRKTIFKNDKEELDKINTKISQCTQEYAKFSKEVGLPTKVERLGNMFK